MMNFGETLAYWYLRLNGFLPITNFVLHRHENTVERSADSDLLAIRFPHVYEEIGGQSHDWDPVFSESWSIDLSQDLVALIVEVKTGKNMTDVRNGINRAFQVRRLVYAIRRLGIWPADDAAAVAVQLANQSSYRAERCVIAKLLIATQIPDGNYLSLPLPAVATFITQRMERYIDSKSADRLFFPSDLLQYIIWSREEQME